MLNILRKIIPWKPSKKWLAEAERPKTPDVVQLSLSEYQNVFVVDDMKLDFPKYSAIAEHSAFLARAFTQKPFSYFVKNVGNEKIYIPLAAVDGKIKREHCKISGELHTVKSTRIMDYLDIAKDNGVQFIRQRTKLIVPYRELHVTENKDADGRPLPPELLGKRGLISPEKVHIVEAWMYVGNPEYWDDMIDRLYFDGGNLFEPVWRSTAFRNKRWLDRYYNLVQPYEKPKRNNR